MTTQLSSLAIRPDLDPSKFVEGTKQLEAAATSGAKAVVGLGAAGVEANTKLSQAGNASERLARQFVDGYASAQRFQSALSSLSREMEKGNLSIERAQPILDGIYRKYGLMGDAAQFAAKGQMELAAAITNANARIEQQRRIVPANTNVAGRGNFAGLMAGQQFQDIAITSMMGQSIPTIMLQQGTQLGAGLQMSLGEQGALGAVKTLGTAFVSLFSPINLLAIGLTGVVAAGIQFATSFSHASKEAEEFGKWLDKIGSSANTTADFLDRVSKATQGLTAVDLNKLARQGQAYIKDQRSQLSNPLAEAAGYEGNLSNPAFVQTYNLIDKVIGNLRSDDGFKDIDDLHHSLNQIVAEQPYLQKFAETWEDLGEAILKAKEAAEQAARQAELASHNMSAWQPRDGAAIQAYLNRNADTLSQLQRQRAVDLSTIGARSPDELRRAAEAREAARPVDPRSEGPEVRNYRIASAGAVAYAQAMHQLDEAQRQRKSSLDATLASQEFDVDLSMEKTQ